jgi:hypothetical protein
MHMHMPNMLRCVHAMCTQSIHSAYTRSSFTCVCVRTAALRPPQYGLVEVSVCVRVCACVCVCVRAGSCAQGPYDRGGPADALQRGGSVDVSEEEQTLRTQQPPAVEAEDLCAYMYTRVSLRCVHNQ